MAQVGRVTHSAAIQSSPMLLSSSQLLSESGWSCSPPPDRSLVEQGAAECAEAGKKSPAASWLTEQPRSWLTVRLQRSWFSSGCGQGLGAARGTGLVTLSTRAPHTAWGRGSRVATTAPGAVFRDFPIAARCVGSVYPAKSSQKFLPFSPIFVCIRNPSLWSHQPYSQDNL